MNCGEKWLCAFPNWSPFWFRLFDFVIRKLVLTFFARVTYIQFSKKEKCENKRMPYNKEFIGFFFLSWSLQFFIKRSWTIFWSFDLCSYGGKHALFQFHLSLSLSQTPTHTLSLTLSPSLFYLTHLSLSISLYFSLLLMNWNQYWFRCDPLRCPILHGNNHFLRHLHCVTLPTKCSVSTWAQFFA